jgi:hypothetical protein
MGGAITLLLSRLKNGRPVGATSTFRCAPWPLGADYVHLVHNRLIEIDFIQSFPLTRSFGNGLATNARI